MGASRTGLMEATQWSSAWTVIRSSCFGPVPRGGAVSPASKRRPSKHAIEVTVIDHHSGWEYRYPSLKVGPR